MHKSIVHRLTRGTMDLRIALEKLSPWRETLSLAKTWWYNYANCSNDPELASFPRSHSSIQNKLNLRFVNTITTNHIYNLVKTRGVNGFFSNLVYLLNNVTAHKIVGNHCVLKTQCFPPILWAIYHYLINRRECKSIAPLVRRGAMDLCPQLGGVQWICASS